MSTYIASNSPISSAKILKRSLFEKSKDKTNYRTVWGHSPKNGITEYSWKMSQVSWSIAGSSTFNDKSQRIPQSIQGDYNLHLLLSVNGGRWKEGENVNYKFGIQLKRSIQVKFCAVENHFGLKWHTFHLNFVCQHWSGLNILMPLKGKQTSLSYIYLLVLTFTAS